MYEELHQGPPLVLSCHFKTKDTYSSALQGPRGGERSLSLLYVKGRHPGPLTKTWQAPWKASAGNPHNSIY